MCLVRFDEHGERLPIQPEPGAREISALPGRAGERWAWPLRWFLRSTGRGREGEAESAVRIL